MKSITTREMVLWALFVALTAVCSQIMIPLPFTPIMINLGTFAVFLAGGLLGARGGFFSLLAFVLLGAVGVPVFAGFKGGLGALLGPTGGYLIGYILAAWLVGLLTARWKLSYWRIVGAMALGMVSYFLLGTVWYMILTGNDLKMSLLQCVIPFLPGDALKIALAALLTLRLRPRLSK